MDNETLPPPPPPPPPPVGVRGAGRERVPMQRAGRLFGRTADRYGASNLFFSQQQEPHEQLSQKTKNMPFTNVANNAINAIQESTQPAVNANVPHMSGKISEEEQIKTNNKTHDPSIPTLAIHRIHHREQELREQPQKSTLLHQEQSQEEEKEKEETVQHSELQEEEEYSVPTRVAFVSRRQLSVNESASPRPRTPLYDSNEMQFLPIQQEQTKQHHLKQNYNLEDSTPELYQANEVPPSHSAFASTPRVNLNLEGVEAKPTNRFANTTRSINNNNIGGVNDNKQTNSPFQLHTYRDAARLTNNNSYFNNNNNKKVELSSAPLSAKSANTITNNTLLRRDVPLFSRSRELTQSVKTPAGNFNVNNNNNNSSVNERLTNAHPEHNGNVLHSNVNSSRSTLRSSLPLHEGTPTNAITSRNSGEIMNSTNKNDKDVRVNSLTRHSLGLSLYSHNRSTPRREGLLEAALRRREENRLGHHSTQTPLSNHLQHDKVYKNTLENSTINAFAQKRVTDSPAIRTPISPFVKNIPTDSNSSAVITEELKEQQQQWQNDTTNANTSEVSKVDNEYVQPHNTHTIEDANHNLNLKNSSNNKNNYERTKDDYVPKNENEQVEQQQQLLPTTRGEDNNVFAPVHREKAQINPFLSNNDEHDSKKSNNNNNHVENNDDEEEISNTNSDVIGIHVSETETESESESESEPSSQYKLPTNSGTQWILNKKHLQHDKDDFSLDSHVHSTRANKEDNNNNNITLPMQQDMLKEKEEEEEEYPLPRAKVEEQEQQKLTKVASSSHSSSSSSPSFASSSSESLFSDKRNNNAEREKMYKFAQHSIVPIDAPDDNPFLESHKSKKDNHNENGNVGLTVQVSNTLDEFQNTTKNNVYGNTLCHVDMQRKLESPRLEAEEEQSNKQDKKTIAPENVFRLPHSHATTITPQQPFADNDYKNVIEETDNLEHVLESESTNESTPNPFLSSTHEKHEDVKTEAVNKHVDEAYSCHATTSTPSASEEEVYCPCFAVFIPTKGKFVVGYNTTSHTSNNKSGCNERCQLSNHVNAKQSSSSLSLQEESSLSTAPFCNSYLCICSSLHNALSAPESLVNHIPMKRHTRGDTYVKLLRTVATSPFFASINKPPLNKETLSWAANLLQVDNNHTENEFYSDNMDGNIVKSNCNVEECIPYSLRRVLLCLIEFAQQNESNERRFVWSKGGQKRLIECLVNTENITFIHHDDSNGDDNNKEREIDELRLTHSNQTVDLLVHASKQTSFQISSQHDEVEHGTNSSSNKICKDGVAQMNNSKISLLKSKTSTISNSVNESNNALIIVEKLISVGKREEAVNVALQHHLFHHAILISMVCAHKDYYLQTVDAIVKEQLSQHSPLAHAYCLFNNRIMPPFSVNPDNDKTNDVQNGDTNKSNESIICNNNNQNKGNANVMLNSQKVKLQRLLELHRSWRTHASVLISNFSPTSVAALLQLSDELQQANLILSAHTCLLLILLTPVMTNNNANITKGAGESHLPMSRNEAAQQLVRRLGVLGGLYHPTQSCRANFLAPLSTILTDILQEVRVHLCLSPPLHNSNKDNNSDDIPKISNNSNSNSNTTNVEKNINTPGIPERSARFAINFHFMQIIWLYEVGMHQEASQALEKLLTILPAPGVALSVTSEPHEPIPNTLNAFVYAISRKYLPSKTLNAVHLHESNATDDNKENKSNIKHDNILKNERHDDVETELETPSRDYHDGNTSSPLNVSSTLPPEPSFNLPPQTSKTKFHKTNTDTKSHDQRRLFNIAQPTPPPLPPPKSPSSTIHETTHTAPPLSSPPPPPPLPPPQPPQPSAEKVNEKATELHIKNGSTESPTDSDIHGSKNDSLSAMESLNSNVNSSNSNSKNSSMDRSNGVNNSNNDNNKNTRNANNRDKEEGNSKNNKAPPPPPQRRSRSIDAIMRLFGRGKSEKPDDQAKPMILNSDKPPEFDEATGRWMFPETEEEKAERELIKRGPPKRPAPVNEVAPHSNNSNRVMHESNVISSNNYNTNNNNKSSNEHNDNIKSNEPPLPLPSTTTTTTIREKQSLPSPPPPILTNVAVPSSGPRLFGAAPPIPVGRGQVLPARRGRGGALGRPQYVDLFN